MKRVYARAYGAGRCTAAANAPDEFSAMVQSELQGCIRLTPYVDKEVLAAALIGRGLAADVAHMVAQTAEISDDEAYFARDWPK
jgi:hypothetical protein